LQVADLQLEKQQMQASQHALEQQMAAFQQQLQQLQQEVHISSALGRSSPALRSLAGVDDACAASAAVSSTALGSAETGASASSRQQDLGRSVAGMQRASSGSGSRRSSHHSRHSSRSSCSVAAVAGTVLEPRGDVALGNRHLTTSIHADECSSPSDDNGRGSTSCLLNRSKSTSAVSTAQQQHLQHLQHSASMPVRRGSSSSSHAALALAQQVAQALPGHADSSLQGQMASLMSAIAAGVKERKALAAQGQVLLEMVTGSSSASL
jgi:hypothetical protein